MKHNIMNLWIKRGIILTSDLLTTILAWFSAYWLCTRSLFVSLSINSLITIIALQTVIYLLCGLYRGVWRFASIPDLFRILRAVCGGTFVIIIMLHFQHVDLPIQVDLAYLLLITFFLCAPRFFYRWYRDYRKHIFHSFKRVLIVGAGYAAESIVRDLKRFPLNKNFVAVALVDDDQAKRGNELHGVRVVGTCEDIPLLTEKLKIDLILIAIPSASSSRMREIVSYCEQSKIVFRTLPGLKDIADGNVSMNALRDVQLEDLLGREQVTLDWDAIQHSILNKTILVTGGGGSIGSELCRQICRLSPKRIIIIDKNEYNLYEIDKELKDTFNIDIQSHLCCVTDQIEMNKIFNLYRPEIVFHVAAYKHVPLLETHLRIAMQNNIIGTHRVAQLADQYHVATFVLISTDKAVNPSNIMGATKRASEMICQNFNLYSKTRFITVRFGNVLASSGSVIPLFRKQLAEGGPLTVTHPEISRYFMTIPEASLLILQAVTMDTHGEIFVLDMGNPVKIRYLAEQLIKLSGKKVDEDIKIHYTGLRPGEKLYEELFHENENISKTSHPKIRSAKVRFFHWETLLSILHRIEIACDLSDDVQLEKLLFQMVPEYHAFIKPPAFTEKKLPIPLDSSEAITL